MQNPDSLSSSTPAIFPRSSINQFTRHPRTTLDHPRNASMERCSKSKCSTPSFCSVQDKSISGGSISNVLRYCFRRRKFRVGQSDDGLSRWHGRRRRGSHPRQFEPRKRDVASAQREPARTLLAGRDEAPSASARATAHSPSPPYAWPPSTAATAAAAPRGLHATVLLVPSGS